MHIATSHQHLLILRRQGCRIHNPIHQREQVIRAHNRLPNFPTTLYRQPLIFYTQQLAGVPSI